MRISKKARKRKKKLQMKNKRLIKKYYWLMPRNVYSGQILKDYDYTWVDWGVCKGWSKAYGDMYLKELGAAVEEAGIKDFMILQEKEKFGMHRMYVNHHTEKIKRIIDKYEVISQNICMDCGREAPMIDDGYMMPMCLECFVKHYKRREAWVLENHPEKSPTPDEDIIKRYNSIICDKPNEDGTWLSNTYTMRTFGKDGDKDITYDISDTVEKIRNKMSHMTS